MSGGAVFGVDLGTTHSAVARAVPGDAVSGGAPPTSELLQVTQVVSKGEVGKKSLLPSFLYFLHETDGKEGLPWDPDRAYVVGELARARGVEAPNRVIASAKSWLCHPTADRRSGLLPQNAPADVEPISPVEASWRYLEHLGEACAHETGESLADAEVILTVPASFDAAARELTVEAAMAAGIEKLTLLEEPQAALYAWLEARGDAFRKDLSVGDVIVVIDVGGGTTDFSAIEVRDEGGSLALARVAVGDHILLGGDNMDLTLAHMARQKLEAAGKEVDRMQMASLGFAARTAKEKLLGDDPPASAPIAVAGRGSQLLGSALRTELTQAEVETAIVDGFFPVVPHTARPAVRARGALRELGLPYASEPAVTKHLAAFLAKQAAAVSGTGDAASGTSADRKLPMLCPTAVLFNGGVMKSARIQNRIVETLTGWMAELGRPAPRVLEGGDLDHAVARGAAYYGLVRRGKGLRIRGGTARAYYVGIEQAAPAVPGMAPPVTALCVAPFGMEEGSHASLPRAELGVVVGEPVQFRFFGSTTRHDDRAGTTLERWKEGELEELPPIEVTLPAEGRSDGDVVPVKLEARVTEVGTLLLEALPDKPLSPDERWKIELSVRQES